MAKITKREFENYSKQFLTVFARLTKFSEFESLSEDKKEEERKILALILNGIERGNVFALNTACLMGESLLKEDFSTIKSKVKEHIIARGYYNPTSPLT